MKQAGAEALRNGNAAEARTLFGQLIATGRADTQVWTAMAIACRALGDEAGMLAAIDRALAIEPRNLRALVMKADHFDATGDTRAASSFYAAAVKSAPQPALLAPDMREEVERARAKLDSYAGRYESFLRERLREAGFADIPPRGRFGHSLDLLLGKKQIYLQDPLFYYFPELPQIQFYERSLFPWLDRVEAATGYIRAELLDVLKEEGAFSPYVEKAESRPVKDHQGMLNNPDWSAFYLWKNGTMVPENAARCPKTLEALGEAPLAKIEGHTPSILFSLLRPGAHIPPHNGFINTRLICHLPLIVPGKCRFRVGNDMREWVEGKAWVFDDTIQHEAWNDSNKTRVILLFDIWRPELTAEERAQVAAVFGAVDAFDGGRREWNI